MAGSIDFTARVSIFNKTKPVWLGRLNIFKYRRKNLC